MFIGYSLSRCISILGTTHLIKALRDKYLFNIMAKKQQQKNNNIKIFITMETEGTKENPWKLKTPPLTSEYEMYKDVKDGRDIIMCIVGKTTLIYDAKCLTDLHTMLKKHGDWMELGSADEQKLAKEGTVEAWGRSENNPNGGWYGLKKGLRGRFGMYIPPLMEKIGLAEVTHDARGNKMRAK